MAERAACIVFSNELLCRGNDNRNSPILSLSRVEKNGGLELSFRIILKKSKRLLMEKKSLGVFRQRARTLHAPSNTKTYLLHFDHHRTNIRCRRKKGGTGDNGKGTSHQCGVFCFKEKFDYEQQRNSEKMSKCYKNITKVF